VERQHRRGSRTSGGRAVAAGRCTSGWHSRLSAASAERSGTAVVRITHNGELWAGRTIRWHDGDLALLNEYPVRQRRVGALVDVALTVGADDIVRQVAVTGGPGATP